MLATGIANFLHVRHDSLRFLPPHAAAAVARSTLIRRRSGVEKFEVDLRDGRFRLAPKPAELTAIVFLTHESAAGGPLIARLPRGAVRERLRLTQAYAMQQPGWRTFESRAAAVGGFELRRGQHPRDAVAALWQILGTARGART
jgi:hypothetical protein